MNIIYLRALSTYFGPRPCFAQSSLNYATLFCCQREERRHEVAARNRTKGLPQCERSYFCYTLCMRHAYTCSMQEWAGLLQRLYMYALSISSAVVAPARGVLSLRLAALCSRVRRRQPQGQLVSGPTPTSNSCSLGVWVCYHIMEMHCIIKLMIFTVRSYNALREGRLMQNHSEGFYLVNTTVDGTNQTAHRAEVDFFPYWCFLIAAPFLYIFTFLHLLIGRCLTGILVSYTHTHTHTHTHIGVGWPLCD